MWQTLSRSSSAAEIAMRARTSVRKTWMFDFIEVSSTGWRVGISFCRHVVSACGAKKASLQSRRPENTLRVQSYVDQHGAVLEALGRVRVNERGCIP